MNYNTSNNSKIGKNKTGSFLVLDVPDMSGFQFIQNIKLMIPKINVLLMSAFEVIGDSEISTHLNKYEVDGFLRKPIFD